jgi:hypothetical protein
VLCNSDIPSDILSRRINKPLCSHLESKPEARALYAAYGVRTSLSAVFVAVLSSRVARRTVERTDLGFSLLNFDARFCL